MPAIPNGTPQANPAIDKNAKKDELNEKFSKFVRRIKLLFSSEGQGEQYLKVKMSRFPIEAVIVAGIVIIANGIYIGNYFVKKAHNTELENKVKTEWADVSAKKSDIESMAKVQKGVAPQTKYYETAIRLIVKSGV